MLYTLQHFRDTMAYHVEDEKYKEGRYMAGVFETFDLAKEAAERITQEVGGFGLETEWIGGEEGIWVNSYFYRSKDECNLWYITEVELNTFAIKYPGGYW